MTDMDTLKKLGAANKEIARLREALKDIRDRSLVDMSLRPDLAKILATKALEGKE